jgi:hypothetical protein
MVTIDQSFCDNTVANTVKNPAVDVVSKSAMSVNVACRVFFVIATQV